MVNEERRSKTCGRRTQLGILCILDFVAIALMVYSTRVQFAKAAGYTPTLNSTYKVALSTGGPIAGPINNAREKLLYLIYAAIGIFSFSTSIYTLFAIFGQYTRRKQWEANHSPEELNNGTANNPWSVNPKTDMPRLPRSRCIDITRYIYALGWLFTWIASGIGILVLYLDKTDYKFIGMFQVEARSGASALAVAWILVNISGLWRLIYKIASSSG